MRYLFLIASLVVITACAPVIDRDGGIGGTGTPVSELAL